MQVNNQLNKDLGGYNIGKVYTPINKGVLVYKIPLEVRFIQVEILVYIKLKQIYRLFSPKRTLEPKQGSNSRRISTYKESIGEAYSLIKVGENVDINISGA